MHISSLTVHTLRYLYYHYKESEIFECNSPSDVKMLVWQRIKPILQGDDQGFLKGIKLCDFNALYEWIASRRIRNEKELVPDCTSNVGGRLTDKSNSFRSDALPTAIGGGDGNEVIKDGGGKDDAFSPHPLFGSDAVSGQ